mmetsp:Transcript_49841/g.75832  ORF Transcript_49841/g.75832 Transcript_49841/m.75832 type:complete len:89 (+) Transcript_49841:2-268(+)
MSTYSERAYTSSGVSSASDSSLSASQLRQRYNTAPDDALSASQIRSRHAVQGNSAGWSEKPAAQNLTPIFIVIATVVIGAIVFFLSKK